MRSWLDARLMPAPGYSVSVRYLAVAWKTSVRRRGELERFRQATMSMMQGIDLRTRRRVFANVRLRDGDWFPARTALVLDGKTLVQGRRSLRTRLKAPARAQREGSINLYP